MKSNSARVAQPSIGINNQQQYCTREDLIFSLQFNATKSCTQHSTNIPRLSVPLQIYYNLKSLENILLIKLSYSMLVQNNEGSIKKYIEKSFVCFGRKQLLLLYS